MPALLPGPVGDGQADIYLHGGGLMANHTEGRDPCDLLVREPRQQLGYHPVGCPTCLTQPGQMEELPQGLDDDVVVAETGADLLAAIQSH
jgi:hypothetical protein